MWMGDSRGRFDGDTLVIETTNFTDRTGLGGNGNGAVHSENLTLVERLRRVDADTLRYEFTVNDPRDVHAAVDRRVRPRQQAGLRDLRVRVPRGQLRARRTC